MSESMIKKVSLALAEADNAVATYDDLARAAIESMLEPTRAMVRCAESLDAPDDGGWPSPEASYAAMLAEALRS